MKFSTITAALALCTAGAAFAQDAAAPAEATPPVTFTGTAAFVTDYRFRGVSLSDRDIAGQASITATSSFGLFASIWGSTIEPVGAYIDKSGNFNNGSEQEIDLTLGFSKAIGNFTPSFGVIGYIYPGGKNVAYYEPFVSVAGTLGPVGVTVGLNYAPDQENTFEDNTYVYGLVTFGIPDSPITLKGSVGYEDGAFDYGSGGKFDYMVGVDAKYKFLTLGVQYIGNDLDNSSFALRRNRKDGVVVSLTAAF
ncbi:TorF family putative porin [Glacieibacterium frigidum]|uniref:Porin n=1 Tax=Glacieibacterium frigidum TaxID=2593303 RepID=A0A552U734_9SPHN|nr:TorF family putative porin [Glacieibacterium frigidum]TRW13989.1 hypothetical protein FMM06_09600 [Glacieibacterium frigidum]